MNPLLELAKKQEKQLYKGTLLLIISYAVLAIFVMWNISLINQIEVKNKQIDGLHKQLRRTQYQLKRSREQNVEQTARIAELTNNGG
ncbi:hypothetical protein VMHJH2_09590 [Streptococcus uberis]|uniref:hypothetical protein n=1 Tax=Streptococcus uberis TaxID=1349 RepID=UPI00214FAD01|nr:hypothetical protein [Streptococcus uberis]MCR4258771.1 hypothetical protein [Streptococcus uberis]